MVVGGHVGHDGTLVWLRSASNVYTAKIRKLHVMSVTTNRHVPSVNCSWQLLPSFAVDKCEIWLYNSATMTIPSRAVYRNFAKGVGEDGKFGVRTKEGGGAAAKLIYEVLHPTLARGGLKYSPAL